jgi:outer membrane murein-binding lipoprotein Lpp
MPPASSDQIRRELAAEREQLGTAVRELHREIDELRRKLPYYAAAAVAAGVAIGIVRKKLSR